MFRKMQFKSEGLINIQEAPKLAKIVFLQKCGLLSTSRDTP